MTDQISDLSLPRRKILVVVWVNSLVIVLFALHRNGTENETRTRNGTNGF